MVSVVLDPVLELNVINDTDIYVNWRTDRVDEGEAEQQQQSEPVRKGHGDMSSSGGFQPPQLQLSSSDWHLQQEARAHKFNQSARGEGRDLKACKSDFCVWFVAFTRAFITSQHHFRWKKREKRLKLSSQWPRESKMFPAQLDWLRESGSGAALWAEPQLGFTRGSLSGLSAHPSQERGALPLPRPETKRKDKGETATSCGHRSDSFNRKTNF